MERRLASIIAADVVGYSRLMQKDEEGTLADLVELRRLIASLAKAYGGRAFGEAGDSILAEFASPVEAVRCAMEIQQEMAQKYARRKRDRQMQLRIGVHLGDIIVEGSNLFGEGVNLASRLETMAEPGGVLVSQQIYDQVYSKLTVQFDYLGEKRPKNFVDDVAVYRISSQKRKPGAAKVPRKRPRPKPTVSPEINPKPELRERVIRHAKLLGILLLVLMIVDIITGRSFFTHWVAIGPVAFLSWEAAPLSGRSGIKLFRLRVLLLLGALALVNLFSWSGYPWVFWPAGALIAADVTHRLFSQRR
ncbi:MAG: adenylate/guanylate cyclase domain-containing protein [Rhodobacteraceae bacterium]|nr:adenylate/guanylate cyclase domain-containing protein [Paracoccaceae bacterium]